MTYIATLQKDWQQIVNPAGKRESCFLFAFWGVSVSKWVPYIYILLIPIVSPMSWLAIGNMHVGIYIYNYKLIIWIYHILYIYTSVTYIIYINFRYIAHICTGALVDMSFCLMGDTKLSSKQRWEKVWQSLWCYLTTCSEHESSQWKFQDPKMEVPCHNSGGIPLHRLYIDQ